MVLWRWRYKKLNRRGDRQQMPEAPFCRAMFVAARQTTLVRLV
jgi:hypothetical protein